MKYFLYFITNLVFTFSFAQSKTDSLCSCSETYSIRYPKQAEKDGASGIVIVELDEDEDCNWSNPVIIQKAGHGFDEEALRIMTILTGQHNACVNRCKNSSCRKHKLKQAIRFLSPEE